MCWCLVLCASFVLASSASAPVVLEPLSSKPDTAPERLLILIPGGKVPIENYTMTSRSIQDRADVRLWVGIPHCFQNLCDPLDNGKLGLNAAVDALMVQVRQRFNPTPSEIFISGHSLGGVGARHYYDTHPGHAGLALFGSQYTGDHEDDRGPLGYPSSLADFPGPFLAVGGELDKMPVSHAALLYEQWALLPTEQQDEKAVVIVPLMDHSDFCPGFHVPGDIVTELTREESQAAIGDAVGSWLSAQVLPASPARASAVKILRQSIAVGAPVMQPFLEARMLDDTWCAEVQRLMSSMTEEEFEDHVYINSTTVVNSSANLEHAHTSYVVTQSTNGTKSSNGTRLAVNIVSYAYYDYIDKNFTFLDAYAGATSVQCKSVSGGRIAQQLNLTFPDTATCREANEHAAAIARDIVRSSWPSALERFETQGSKLTFTDDNVAIAGPQFIYLSKLAFSKKGVVQAASLYSSITSKIFPGNHYCKVLSPAKAVEWLMTESLQRRYPK